jgi:hypothetical protein
MQSKAAHLLRLNCVATAGKEGGEIVDPLQIVWVFTANLRSDMCSIMRRHNGLPLGMLTCCRPGCSCLEEVAPIHPLPSRRCRLTLARERVVR